MSFPDRVAVNLVFDKINSFLGRRSYAQIIVICLLLSALIAKIDLLSGYEISVSIFFLLPIAISTWYGSHRAGIFFCVLSAALWLIMDDVIFQHPYANAFAPYWNAAVRLCVFLIAGELLNHLKIHLNNEKLQARTDDLTGLLNARGFTEQAEKLFGVSARHNRNITLACIDLDNFRKVNEQSGQKEGDELLRAVGSKIAASLRASDVAGRMGGDEFAIVLPETDEAGARSMFDTFRITMQQEMEKNNWPVSFSMGVVSYNSPRANPDDAIRIADSLLYQAKTGGKNATCFASYPVK